MRVITGKDIREHLSRNHGTIAYAYEAATHSPLATFLRFGLSMDSQLDREGDSVTPIFAWDEGADETVCDDFLLRVADVPNLSEFTRHDEVALEQWVVLDPLSGRRAFASKEKAQLASTPLSVLALEVRMLVPILMPNPRFRHLAHPTRESAYAATAHDEGTSRFL